MTHPTTKPVQSIRDRLHSKAKRYLLPQESDTNIWAALDAILAELQEPSKETIEIGNTVTENAGDIWEPSEGISYDGPSCGLECWQAMLQHIRDGGK